MAQHDYVISNGTGSAVRSDLNNALAAIVSQNSGSTAPSPTYAYQLWADTSTNLLKLRNGANSAWITVGDLTAANLGLAALASPTFTGTVTIPTATISTGAGIPLGSAASPTIYFTGDTNTGIYSPGADQFAITTGGTGRLVIDSSGRLGLGTSSPSNRLDVRSTSTPIQSYFDGADLINTNANNVTLKLRDITYASGTGSSNTLISWTDSNDVQNAYIGVIHNSYYNANGSLVFGTSSGGTVSERLRITSAGLVGIGSNAPGNKLVANTTALTSSFDGIVLQNNSTPTSFGLYFAGSSYSYGTATSAGDAWLYSSTQPISIMADGASSTIKFSTGAGGPERGRWDSSGRFLVGTSSVYSDSAELLEVYKSAGTNRSWTTSPSLSNDDEAAWGCIGGVSGSSLRQIKVGVYKHSGIASPCAFMLMQAVNADSYYYWTDNTSMFRISTLASNIGTTGGTVVGTQTSDERIKNIIGPVEYGLETVKQIDPVRYSLKADPETEKLGFIAQQVAPLVPQAIYDTNEPIEGEPEGAPTKLGMEYVALIPVLVNAIKELSAEVDALKAQLQAQ